MSNPVQAADLGFFCVLASTSSLSAAARELGVTTPAVSKHLAQMEARLGLTLVNRSTRRMSMTPEGESYLEHARHIVPNRRLLCASPAYLSRHGMPKVPNDLITHNCIGIRQGEEAYGLWRLSSGRGKNASVQAVKTRGNLTTNDGEIAVSWALDGHGILMRAEWDIARHLANGRLVQVLPQYFTPDADVYAVYPQRHQTAARVRAFVDFATLSFTQEAAAGKSR